MMLIGALGCNLAWGIIDAILYLMGTSRMRAVVSRRSRRCEKRPMPDGPADCRGCAAAPAGVGADAG